MKERTGNVSEVKWIKINTDIFDDEKFKMIDAMPEADAIQLMWFKLLVFAGKSNNNGLFFFNDRIAYNDEMLSAVFNRPIATVRLAMQTFLDFGMIEEIEGVYTIPNWNKHQSISDAYEKKKERDREYKKKQRSEQKQAIEEKSSDMSSDMSSDVGRFCSYSISNSNISNFFLLIDSNEYISIKENEELIEIIKDWLEYKDSKGKQHLRYAEKSLKTLLNTFIENHNKYGVCALRSIVDYSVGQGYQGIVWDKLTNQKEIKNKPKTQQEYIERWANV